MWNGLCEASVPSFVKCDVWLVFCCAPYRTVQCVQIFFKKTKYLSAILMQCAENNAKLFIKKYPSTMACKRKLCKIAEILVQCWMPIDHEKSILFFGDNKGRVYENKEKLPMNFVCWEISRRWEAWPDVGGWHFKTLLWNKASWTAGAQRENKMTFQ